MSETAKGRIGKKHSKETKQKMKEAHKKIHHWNWQGGISSKRSVFMSLTELKEWRISVFERDNYICQECRCSGDMNAHHIIPWRDCKHTLLETHIMNGITLCRKCHQKTIWNEYKYTNKYFKITRGK